MIRIAYFRSRRALIEGRAAEQRNLPRRYSPYANGTPTILWIRWRGSAARSLVGLGFHYQSTFHRLPGADREAVGQLAGLRRWTTIRGDEADGVLSGQGLHGNHGDWRQFGFEGKRWRVYEAQASFDDFATWHVLLYSRQEGDDASQAAEKTHLPSWLWVGVWQLGAAVALVVGAKLLL